MTQATRMVCNFRCLYAPVAAFRIIFSPRRCFYIFFPLFLISPFFPFVPRCVSVCIFRYTFCLFPSCYLLLFLACLFALLRLTFCFSSASFFFASLVFLVAECVCMLVVCSYICSTIISVLQPSRSVRACKSAKNIAFSCVVSVLISCFLVLPCPTWTSFLALLFWMCVVFEFDFYFSTWSCYYHPVYFFLGSMWSSRCPWRLVQLISCVWCVCARTSFLRFVWGRCRCGCSVIVCTTFRLF